MFSPHLAVALRVSQNKDVKEGAKSRLSLNLTEDIPKSTHYSTVAASEYQIHPLVELVVGKQANCRAHFT